MSRRINLGDLVTMPLPTEWGPEVVPQPAGGAPLSQFSNLGIPLPVVAQPYPAPPNNPLLYAPQRVLPDSVLPPALQRTNPLLRFAQFIPNAYDQQLHNKARTWDWIKRHGGLMSVCRVPKLGAPMYDQDPTLVMPSQGEKFEKMFAQLLANVSGPPPFTGFDTIIGQLVVPNGYDGVINRIVVQFTGDGFQEFSGAISWRVQVGTRFVRNLGNIQNTFGSYQAAFLVPGTDHIKLVSGQTITLWASIPFNSPLANGSVTAGAFGWFYPRR